MITLVIADDHRIVRQGVATLLSSEEDLQIVGEAENGHEALELVRRHLPDVLLLDLLMPGMNGLEVIRQLSTQKGMTRIIVLSMLDDELYVSDVLKHGAMGYVLKEAASEVLIQAIRSVMMGLRYLCPPLVERAIDAYVQQLKRTAVPAPASLTAREMEILRMAAEGLSASAIAERLVISRRTVETHRANMMKKLGIHNQTELVRYALKQGLVSIEET